MTARKVVDLKRHEARERCGGGRVMGESGLGKVGSEYDPSALAKVIGDAPTPEFAAMMVEQCQRLFAKLGDPSLEALASAKLEGYTNQEIARQLDCSRRTVERRLDLIRRKWQEELPP